MSNSNENLVFCVTRILVTFENDLGETKNISGSGFNITFPDGKNALVTNKHNLDPTLKLGKATSFKLSKLSIQLRLFENNTFTQLTQFFDVNLNSTKIISSETADVSLVVTPVYFRPDYRFTSWNLRLVNNFADQKFFKEKVKPMDIASFIGYPGNGSSQWWDTAWQLPIARTVNIASTPHIPFTNPEILTADVALVSGLSFSGSSGSLVLLHQKGLSPGDVYDPLYVPAKVVGIMSGHWSEKDPESKMFNHTGLSYFTRSTSILELVSKSQIL